MAPLSARRLDAKIHSRPENTLYRCLISTLVAAAISSAAPARGDGPTPWLRVAESVGGPSSQAILYPVVAESSANAAVQGTVFAGAHRWTCVARRCRSSIVGRHFAGELQALCAALAAEVGPLRTFIAGDLRFTEPALAECNQLKERVLPSGPARMSSRFSLVRESGRYWLVLDGRQKLAVPSDWILPPDDTAQERDGYVSTTEFDRQVQEFPIGGDLTGLHVSSYAISREGSAQAAAGRDVFMIYDPRTNTLTDGGIHLGVTKARHRAAGHWSGRSDRFYLQDANADGRLDVGVVTEEIHCSGSMDPPFKASAVRWHVLRDGRWITDRAHDGVQPISSRASELQQMGLEKSPVEFVRARCAAPKQPPR